jgi:tRNA-splicing ligase RtcB
MGGRLSMKSETVIFGEHDQGTLDQIERCAQAGEYSVLCADGHKGYAQPIGGVIAYKNHISVSGVGFDIACGNMAVRTAADPRAVQQNIRDIMLEVTQKISFGVGRANDTPVSDLLFNHPAWDYEPLRSLKQKAEAQLGTVGSGNHYVDIFIDEENWVWVGVHFGSRGFGHAIATYFLKAAGAKDGMDVDPCLLDADSALGMSYLECMRLAGRYAYAGRGWVVEQILDILDASPVFAVHNHHNYCWEEEHYGEQLYVVRKGATPAFPGQLGFVGGSMGDDAVILRGIDSEHSRQALYSTVHGAGRIMSRTMARGKFVKDANGKKQRQPGLVRHDKWQEWLKEKGVFVIGGDVDEAPQAYRRLDSVLEAHAGTIEVVHRLRPIGVAMAGGDVSDPYKD